MKQTESMTFSLEQFKAIDTNKSRIIRKRLGLSDSDIALLFRGELIKENNIDELLDYFSKIEKDNIYLVIIGEGTYKETLIALSKKLNINEKVKFVGAIEQNYIADYCNSCDIFVSSNLSQSQGFTYYEAIASGLPVLCHKNSFIESKIINDVNGFMYKNEEEFKHYISNLISCKRYRQNIGNFAKELLLQQLSSSRSIDEVSIDYLNSLNKAI